MLVAGGLLGRRRRKLKTVVYQIDQSEQSNPRLRREIWPSNLTAPYLSRIKY